MHTLNLLSVRVFKTAWFSKAARKARLKDTHLCAAIAQVMQGLAEDLGGGVFKKRLNDNLHRSIILAKGRRLWVYAYLFAKQDRGNIHHHELDAFRELAQAYSQKTESEIRCALATGDLLEICHDQSFHF